MSPDAPTNPAPRNPAAQRKPAAPRNPAAPRLWIAPAAVVLGLAGGVFSSILVEGIGSAFGSTIAHPTPAVTLVADYCFDLAFVASALWFAVLQAKMRPYDFGYRTISLRRGAIAFVVAAVGYYVVTLVYSALFNLHGTDKLPNELGANHSTVALIAAGFFVCAFAPMAEEFFFRGFLFQVLRRIPVSIGSYDLGPWLAAVIVGLLFGLAHTGSAASQFLIPLGFLGFVLCLVRWRTGSLYPCMALHSANNCVALGVNQLHWGIGLIILLIAGSFAVIGAITLPLSRWPRSAEPAPAPG